MKKLLLPIAAVLAFGSANAGMVVNMGPERCSLSHLCFTVPNDGGVQIEYVSDAIQYRRLLIQINGTTYDSGLWALNGQLTQSNVTLYDPHGNSILVSLVMTDVATGPCIRQGRVCVVPRVVTLQSGTITLP